MKFLHAASDPHLFPALCVGQRDRAFSCPQLHPRSLSAQLQSAWVPSLDCWGAEEARLSRQVPSWAGRGDQQMGALSRAGRGDQRAGALSPAGRDDVGLTLPGGSQIRWGQCTTVLCCPLEILSPRDLLLELAPYASCILTEVFLP